MHDESDEKQYGRSQHGDAAHQEEEGLEDRRAEQHGHSMREDAQLR